MRSLDREDAFYDPGKVRSGACRSVAVRRANLSVSPAGTTPDSADGKVYFHGSIPGLLGTDSPLFGRCEVHDQLAREKSRSLGRYDSEMENLESRFRRSYVRP